MEENLGDIVATLAEADAVLVDEGGETIPLACEEASDVLMGVDPWFVVGSKIYRYYPTGTTLPTECTTDPNVICTTSDTPVQDAITAANSGTEIHIEPGTYDETVEIDKIVILTGEG